SNRKLFLDGKRNLSAKPCGLAYELAKLPEDERDAILATQKHLASDPKRLARLGRQLFRVNWLGPAGQTPEEALAGSKKKEKKDVGKKTVVEEAVILLARKMNFKAWPSKELEDFIIRTAGYTFDAYKAAKDRLKAEHDYEHKKADSSDFWAGKSAVGAYWFG